MPSHTLSAMSIAFLHPVLDLMKAQGCSDDILSGHLSISTSQLEDPTTMVPAVRVYGFLEWATEQMGDPWLCARVGQRMANGGWAPINQLLAKGGTVWQFLRRFSVTAEDQGRAASYRLEIEGRIALWKVNRPKGTSDNARFADAIATAFFVEVFKRSQGAEPAECLVMVPDVDLIPDDILPRTNVISGARGMTLRFPSDWLDHELSGIPSLPDVGDVGLPDIGIIDLSERVRRLLDHHLSDPAFGLADVSRSIGVPAWKLQTLLRNAHTSVASIRSDLRLSHAREMLSHGDLSISDIAVKLGYTSPSNFSRAFRAKTGMSPAEFRRYGTTNALSSGTSS